MKSDSNNLLVTVRKNPVLAALVFALVLLIGFITYGLIYIYQESQKDQAYLENVADLRAQSYLLTTLARNATAGEESSFDELRQVLSSMDSSWNQLSTSEVQERELARQDFENFRQVFQRVKDNSGVILENEDTILFLNDVAITLNESLPELQAEHNSIVEILLESNSPGEQVALAQMQSWRAERIGRNVDKMLRGDSDVAIAADQFNLDANLFGKVLNGMRVGDAPLGISKISDPDAISSLDEISELFEFVNSSVREIFESSPALFAARQSSETILDDSPVILESLSAVGADLRNATEARPFNTVTITILAALAVLCLVLISSQLLNATQKRLKETAETNERNQNAILRLLDELADLADGDLTTTATVTEDFTGAIADSINYTIDQLRVLVSRINETSVGVASASQDTQQTALHLAEAAEHQAQEIAGASAAVNEMAVTIDQVSANAAESASVAERAVSIANNGAKVVQNTIHGMDTIREQIQDTSKRIKRLGESSQEIGDIVSLINDIADQTNILALNAAIQASMAGDAGRGFAVVADEVQRLAERSAAATKQIEALVKTIQNDTNEAVISMEQTTAEVVRGARLAQDAGVALEEIENVSTSLADLIQNISNAARQQASSAGHISNTMNVIQEITSQTASGTSATAGSIGTLASMAMELRESVAGFTLPDGSVSETGTHDAISDDDLPVVTDTVSDYGSGESMEEHDYVATLDETVDLQSSEFDEDIHFSVEEESDNLDLEGGKKSGAAV
ncbi:methyl-accepting chemotaxis protein [Sessilibacter corallicola]|uniref:Chemotaxis chemoreceptor PilJ n=1 Tax=Sessilibacter corallicola TaxID=2904075 RepID=A0ABQ0A5K7_9GAMM|nr:methyl-accepting chemotaxis protein [Sessilibacter corallicola]MCE2027716.1 methyl-accepting chemotaxis protein [Sessilibacter corallicola]